MGTTQVAEGEPKRRDLPTGTVTFVFTDIEGSTRLLERLGDAYPPLLAEHHRTLREAFAAEGGREVATEGDSFFVVFDMATRAIAACARAQRALTANPTLSSAAVRVRMGVHTGQGIVAVADYVGLDVHRAARVAAAGHGGQILLSGATRGLVDGALPDGTTLRDLGEHRLKDLSRPERIYQLVVNGLPADFPALRTLDQRRNNLPVQPTTFIGREREVAEARRLLATTRLLTFTGPGGTGKTRLSLQVAAEVSDEFEDGVYFVPLAPIFDPDLVPTAVAEAVGVQESGGISISERLVESLRDRTILLVLDNFEQVTAASSFVTELLRAAPKVKAIVTTRAPLRVYGEQEFPVPPLRLPDARHLSTPDALSQYEAVALFIQRAVAVRPDFAITYRNAPAIAEISARLDGLPLAIELAAARIKILPPEAILSRLDRRLTLLASGARDLPERQQTLRGAIAWSYDLLDEQQRRVFSMLGAFVGGCSLEAAEAVCALGAEGATGDLLDTLAALVDQSLLLQDEHHGEPRFAMLETIREFAREKLIESGTHDEVVDRHARYFLALAERAEPQLVRQEQAIWLDRLDHEQGNIRQALDWARDRGDVETASRLAGAIWRFWQIRGHLDEGAQRLSEVLVVPGAERFPEAHAKALEAAGGVAYWRGQLDEAREYYERALDLNRGIGDRSAIARSLYNLSFPYWLRLTRELVEADPSVLDLPMQLLSDSLALYRELGDDAGIASCLWAMGTKRTLLDERDEARRELAEALSLFRKVGDRLMTAWTLFELGIAELGDRNLDGARGHFTDALETFAASDDRSGIVLLLDAFSAVETEAGDLERAVRLRGASEALGRQAGVELSEVTRRYGRYANPVDRLGAAAAEPILSEASQMSLEEAVNYALRRAPARA